MTTTGDTTSLSFLPRDKQWLPQHRFFITLEKSLAGVRGISGELFSQLTLLLIPPHNYTQCNNRLFIVATAAPSCGNLYIYSKLTRGHLLSTNSCNSITGGKSKSLLDIESWFSEANLSTSNEKHHVHGYNQQLCGLRPPLAPLARNSMIRDPDIQRYFHSVPSLIPTHKAALLSAVI